MSAPDIPAGWQPDPRGRHEYRYWDGKQWTDHVSDQGEVSQDPVADTSPPAAAAGATAASTPTEPVVEREPEPVVEREPEPEPVVASEPIVHSEPDPVVHREPEPVAASSAPPGGVGAGAGTPPATHQTEARAAAQDVLHSKSPEIGTILSAVIPGSGHFYMGASNAIPIGAALLVATVLAVVLSFFNFVLFLVGFVIWAGAAAFALTDLRGGVQSVQGVSLPAQMVGVLLIAAGALLIVSLLLPYYHVKVSVSGFEGTANPSGFQSFAVIDILLLVIGLLAIAAGAVSLGLGPVTAAELPRQLPVVVAVGGAIATALVLFRMFIDPAPGTGLSTGGADIDIGRAPGIWIGLWASLLIVLTNLGTLRSLTNRDRTPTA